MVLTRRLRLKEVLASREEGFDLDELSTLMEVTRSVIISDLQHLQLSLRHRDEQLLMVPPKCTGCGFTFRLERPKAPSKCPSCKSRDLALPVFKVEQPQPAEA